MRKEKDLDMREWNAAMATVRRFYQERHNISEQDLNNALDIIAKLESSEFIGARTRALASSRGNSVFDGAADPRLEVYRLSRKLGR